MRIAIVSVSYGDEYKKKVKYGIVNKKKYCIEHHYDFIDDETCVDLSRDIQWSKIPVLKKYLPLYDYVVWLDADTYITNLNITVESMLDIMGEFSMMYEKDPWFWVNSGFMVLKNDEFCKSILEECYKHTGEICHEQGAIDMLYRINWNNSMFRIKILEHSCGFNQYWNTWKPGDFMIHFPGTKQHFLKENALDILMCRFCPDRLDEESEDEYKNRISKITYENLQEEWKNTKKNPKYLPDEVYK